MWDDEDEGTEMEEFDDEVAQSINTLAEANFAIADEIRQLREDLKDEWLRVIVQPKVTQEGKIRYDMKW